MPKFIVSLLLIIISFSAYSSTPSDQAPTELKNYISNLADKASTILNNSSLSQEAKISQARNLMHDNLDFDWMAKYTLGAQKKTLSETQIKQFVNVYSNYITKAYTDLIKDYKGGKPEITGVRPLSSGDFIVTTNIINNSDEPIKVEYLVRKMKKNNKDIFKVSDIIPEGVSLISGQKAEFTNTLLQHDGFNQLIKNLQNKS